MKTDSFFYRFFHEFPEAFFILTGEHENKAQSYKFSSVEVKEQAFRFDGVFLPESTKELIRFVEVQFKREADFYSRFLSEIFLYLRQFRPENNWSSVVIFPTERADPGVHNHYQELFDSGRIKRIYLNSLPETLLDRFPLGLLKIINAPEEEVRGIAENFVKQIPSAISNKRQQETVVELLVNLLMQKLNNITREEVAKMVEPMMSDIKESRLYQEIAEEGRREGKREGKREGRQEGKLKEKREIAKTMLKKQMSVEIVVEVTDLSTEEVLAIKKQLSGQ